MVVIADTSPLNYLILIDEIDLLPILYGGVLIPEAVALELRHPETPAKVQRWSQNPPAWLEVQTVHAPNDPRLAELDPGEREAIALAIEQGISMVLMDETKGRKQAKQLMLTVRGTLGILEQAAKRGLIQFLPALQKLEATTFRMSDAVRDAAIERSRR